MALEDFKCDLDKNKIIQSELFKFVLRNLKKCSTEEELSNLIYSTLLKGTTTKGEFVYYYKHTGDMGIYSLPRNNILETAKKGISITCFEFTKLFLSYLEIIFEQSGRKKDINYRTCINVCPTCRRPLVELTSPNHAIYVYDPHHSYSTLGDFAPADSSLGVLNDSSSAKLGLPLMGIIKTPMYSSGNNGKPVQFSLNEPKTVISLPKSEGFLGVLENILDFLKSKNLSGLEAFQAIQYLLLNNYFKNDYSQALLIRVDNNFQIKLANLLERKDKNGNSTDFFIDLNNLNAVKMSKHDLIKMLKEQGWQYYSSKFQIPGIDLLDKNLTVLLEDIYQTKLNHSDSDLDWV